VLGGARSAQAAPPIIAEDPARPAPVSITESSIYLYLGDGLYHDVACFVFVNHGPTTATKIGLTLALVDATGTVLATPATWPRGVFPVGARSAYSSGGSSAGGPLVSNSNCFEVSSDGSPTTTFRVTMGRKGPRIDVAAIVVSVRQVWYQDGTGWQAATVPMPGDHIALPTAPPFVAAVPNGPPVITPGTVAGAPLRFVDTYELDDRDSVPLFNRLKLAYTERAACVSFTDLPKIANVVRVGFTLVDRTGNVAGVESLELGGRFEPGILNAGTRCGRIPGKLDADTFVYGRTNVPIGRIIVTPLFVQFADGTTWTAPAPQSVGEPLRLSP